MFANPQIKSKYTVVTWSKLYYKNDGMGASNYNFFYQGKVLENFRITLIGMGVDTVYIAKLRRFRYPDVVNTNLTKITSVAMLPTNIKTFFQECIRSNACLESKIRVL